MSALARLEQLLGPMLAVAIVEAVREELEAANDERSRQAVTGWCSVAEAARTLGVSRRQVYRQVEAGRLPHRRVGERIVLPRAALSESVTGVDVPSPSE